MPAEMSGPGQQQKPGCPECEALRAEVEELRTSREDAVLALAKERELFEALRSKYSNAERFVRTAQQPPLRYVVVDKLNDLIKARFEALHRRTKAATAFLLRSISKSRKVEDESAAR
jgi:hypothetical protein